MKKPDDNTKPKDSFDSENNIKNVSKLSRREALKRIANTSLGVAILSLPALPAFSFVEKHENKQSSGTDTNTGDNENLYLDKYDPVKDVVYSPDGYSDAYVADHVDYGDAYVVDYADYENYADYYNYYSYYCYYGST